MTAHIFNTTILPKHLANSDKSFTAIHTLIYVAAVAVVQFTGGKVETCGSKPRAQKKIRAWEHRLIQIDKLRRQIGKITQFIRGIKRKKVIAVYEKLKLELLKHTKHDPPNRTPEEILDTLKQKLSLKANRLRRYQASRKRKIDNANFQNRESIYRQLRINTKTNTIYTNFPHINSIEEEFLEGDLVRRRKL
ncbi:unnamed protein product [Parnassius apollo]|uniref:(apollo) hypothetical protein n=1 Tax=Parnassius apollo TaxID=110799 RepID=A0A8S3X2F3_PARAO|nr:unnamed protein product [Parnassius apollo]